MKFSVPHALAARSRQAAKSREAEGLLRQRYLAGLQDVTSVLQAECDQLSSADAEILARQSMLEATLALGKSLGGDLL